MIRLYDKLPVLCDFYEQSYQLSHNYGFVNTTGLPVSIIHRDGRVDIIPHAFTSHSPRGRFILAYTEMANPEIRRDISNTCIRTEIMFGIHSKGKKPNHRQQGVKYELTKSDLEGNKSVYFEHLDIVVSSITEAPFPTHPNKKQGAVFTEDDNHNMFIYKMGMVRHAPSLPVYVNINGIVTEVPNIKNWTNPEGYYVVTYCEGKEKLHHYNFNDAVLPFATYDTQAEAVSMGGKLDSERKALQKAMETVQRIEIELSDRLRALNQNEDDKIKRLELEKVWASQIFSADDRIEDKARKREEYEYKAKENILKSNADEQSTIRKNSTEWFKIMPGIITAATKLV